MIDEPQQLSANKQALLKIRALKQQLAEAQSNPGSGGDEPIAIVSMACRFPRRATTPEAFWQCLVDQTDEVGDIPDDRWDMDAFHDDDPEVPGKMYARRGVFLDNLDLMDPEFFGISPREATWIDPQQRLLLEVGWEALERAAWTPKKIGEHTGVFVGWMHNDYQNEASDSFLNLNPYIATGAAGSFLCGRLAYYLGLQGPSVAVDTACSSSLVALHLAIQSLQRRDCDRALVGGVNAIASPTTNILTCKLKALSPTGQSRAFDAGADGYLRGEGCGVVTLRRLSDAQAAGDPILGVVRGSAVGHNGFSSGLTAPNPKAQEKVIRQAIQRAGIEPSQVGYLEAHGTGTELGDPLEMQAAAAALTENRDAKNPLLVGSVKTNIGHLEAAAGMAGLIKVLLAIQHNKIPGQLNFETPNPHIPWDKIPVKVLTESTNWPESDRRIAGVSAFGMSGTNAHIVVEAPPETPIAAKLNQPGAETEAQPHLVVLSGKSDEAVQMLAEEYVQRLSGDNALAQTDLADIAFTSSVGRSHFEHRAAVVATNSKALIENLKAIGRGANSDTALSGSGARAPKVAWQFTGQGSQYIGMARGLYDSQPVFRDCLDHCDELLKQWRDESLIDVLFSDEAKLNHTSWTQPAIFAVQMGLARLLENSGLSPDAVWGHSVGQYAAACVAGIMSWDDGLKLISERGRLIGELPAGGKMLAIFAPVEKVQKELANVETDSSNAPSVSLAAINGTHVVISGIANEIEKISQRLADRNVRCKILTTSHAFHSSLMDPVLEPFAEIAADVDFQPPQIPIICNVTGKLLAADTILDGKYWASHIREAVQFSPTIAVAEELGCQVLLELGPQSVLTRMSAANWSRPAGSLVSCLQKDENDSESLLKAIGQLYVHGCTPDFNAMHAGTSNRSVSLPTYPFQRRRFWGPDKPRAFHAQYHTAHPLLGSPVSLAGMVSEQRFESFVDVDSPSWMPDHEVMNGIVLPGAAYIEMAIAAAGADQIEDVLFEQPLRPQSRTALQTVIREKDATKTIETYSSTTDSSSTGSGQWVRNFAARLVASTGDRPEPIDRERIATTLSESAEPAVFYRKMHELGLNYGPAFQTIQSLQYSKTEVLTHLQTNGDMRGYTVPPTLLDGALHSLAVGLIREDDGNLYLPMGIGRVRCWQGIENEIWCHATWKQNEGKIRTADLVLFNSDGRIAVQIEDLKVQQVSLAALRQMSGSGSERLVYDLNWKRVRLPASGTSNKTWLIVADKKDASSSSLPGQLSQQLASKENQTIKIQLLAGHPFEQVSETEFSFCGEEIENWQQMFQSLSTEETQFEPQGISWLIPDVAIDSPTDRGAKSKATVSGILNLARALGNLEQRKIECGWQFITTGAIDTNEESENSSNSSAPTVDPQQSQFWGLGRVIGAEQPEFRCRLIDLPTQARDSEQTTEAVVELLLTETSDNQFAIRSGQFFVPRMKPVARNRNKSDFAVRADASYLITGGLGMLGRQAAKWLAAHGAKQIVLVSRRAPNESTQLFMDEVTSEFECELVVHSASISVSSDVEKLFSRFGDDLQPLGGVIHAAGMLDDGLIAEQNWSRFEKVLAPKVIGASLLHKFTQSLELDFFVLYSSVASVLGSRGQSNYATANAFLDGLAWQRRQLGLPATSINWGPWTEGMADDERLVKRMALQGITPLSVEEAHAAMEQILAGDVVQGTVMDVDWRRMQAGLGPQAPAMLEGLAPAKRKSQLGDSEFVVHLKRLRGTQRRELLVKTIQESLQRILSTPELPETDRPLIELGLDSLMAVEFGTELQQRLGDQFAVGPTMLFDHPTIDAISDHVLELVAEAADAAQGDSSSAAKQQDEQLAGVSADGQTVRAREDIAIIGMSCRFPGANSIDEFWQNLLNGVDSVREIPSDRWDIDRFYSADREPGKMYTREGGFLEDIAEFDADFFNIAEQEACWIDPQHRMLLENSYLAMEDAGISPQPLADANVGVFMGIMGQDYAFIPTLDDTDIIKAFQGAGLSHSAGVGRISYVFGFEGPSVAVDTASSSSLVALLQAARSLQDGDCNIALAGGVNAILVPVNSLLMSKAGLLSPDGRCKSFSASADGFGRGEGCGVVVLKRLSDAERDGDRIMAVIRGGAVVHNGFSSGITAPSGKSQARVIRNALSDAKVAPSQVQYLEAHGTGTEYGDPMELGAAAKVYGKGRKPDQPLLVGSVKANISHLEAAGGISGIIKTVLALHNGVIPPQANFDEPSPHVPWQRMPVKMVTEATPWPEQHPDQESNVRIAAVTALGLVGTNAHVILSSAPTPEKSDLTDSAELPESPESAESHEQSANDSQKERLTELLVLSAGNQPALTQLAGNLKEFLTSHPETDLTDLCHTVSVGRRHFTNRAAITASSVSDVVEKLTSFVDGRPHSPNGQTNGKTNGRPSTNGAATNGHASANSSVTDGRTEWAQNVCKGTPKIGWLFDGEASEAKIDFAMASQLYATEPVFRELMVAFDQTLTKFAEKTGHPQSPLCDAFENADPELVELGGTHQFALQAGLANLWQSWGGTPDAVLGFGIGQYTAACVAGGLCFQDAMMLVAMRERVERVNNGQAADEPQVDEATRAVLEEFETFADTLNYYPPNLPLICSIDGEEIPVHRSLGGSYWRRHCLATTSRNESATVLAGMNCGYILDLSSVDRSVNRSDLAIKEILESDSTRLLSDLNLSESVASSLQTLLGQLYVGGFNPNFSAASKGRNRISLPPYPFQKKRYWITEVSEFVADERGKKEIVKT